MHVRTLCLGALALGNASGYEIKKMFEEGVFSHFSEASFGSIYPALTRLTDEGLLECEAHSQEGRPDKKVYSITEAGRLALQEALMLPLQQDKYRSDFLFAMLFADLIPANRMKRLLDEKLSELRDSIDRTSPEDDDYNSPSGEIVREFGEHVTNSMIEFLETNRHRIEALGCDMTAPPSQSFEPVR